MTTLDLIILAILTPILLPLTVYNLAYAYWTSKSKVLMHYNALSRAADKAYTEEVLAEIQKAGGQGAASAASWHFTDSSGRVN